ncbi:MAG: hypothetical protein V9F06_15610 [Thermomicrobiales bacterium]
MPGTTRISSLTRQDGDTVYILNLKFWKSIDGGKTFTAIPTQHGDNQDLWIDPADPRRMIEGNDGGANVSFNGGATWSTIYNQPTGQFYHVTTDDRTPYRRVRIPAGQHGLLRLPSSSLRGAITAAEYFEPGGGESGYIAIKPDDNNIVYRWRDRVGRWPRPATALRSADERDSDRYRLAGSPRNGPRRGGAEVPFPVDVSRSHSLRTIRIRSM